MSDVLSAHDATRPPSAGGWQARLELGFAWREQGSYLARRSQCGPLSLQKVLYPEGGAVAHAIVLHPPGGIAGGDGLTLRVTADERASALLTTPGAGKWYRSGGRSATQHIELRAARDAAIEWLPQENIVFDGAQAHSSIDVQLDGSARFIGWEITALGRPASGHTFAHGHFAQQWRITRGEQLLWWEQGRLTGGDLRLQARPGLQGHTVLGTLVAVGFVPSATLLDELRALPIAGEAGVTLTPRGVLLLRCLTPGTEVARAWLTLAWALIRPALLEREAVLPRIWNT